MDVTPRVRHRGRRTDARVVILIAAVTAVVGFAVAGPALQENDGDPHSAEAAAVTPEPSSLTASPGGPAGLAPFGAGEPSAPSASLPPPAPSVSAGLPRPLDRSDPLGAGSLGAGSLGAGSLGAGSLGAGLPGAGLPDRPGSATPPHRGPDGATTPLGTEPPHRPAPPTADTRTSPMRTADQPASKTPRSPAASIRITTPQDGGAVAGTATVSGTADLADRHQVWLLSRQGSGGAYRAESLCRGGREFSCDLTRPAEGEQKFRLAVIVVDPATVGAIAPGTTFDTLPRHAARHEITVRRQQT